MFYAYAAVQIIKQAAEKSNSTDPKKLAEYMHSGAKFDTAVGPISYDKKGDITHLDYDVFVWNSDGKYNTLQ
jgi:branched-chain amino acid transport system substrate-binding protein